MENNWDDISKNFSVAVVGNDRCFVGMHFVGDEILDSYWVIQCPCGVTAHYPINGLPLVDTPHRCGNPLHWSVKFSKEPQ